MYPSIVLMAFAFATCSIALLLRSPLRAHFADRPDHRKVHQQIVPRLGGAGLLLALLAVELVNQSLFGGALPGSDGRMQAAVLSTALFLLVAGSLDDIRPVSFKIKFLMQFSLAAILVIGFGFSFDRLNLFGFSLDLGPWGALFSLVWLVGVMNAFNIIDGIDGLAGGVALCGFTTVAVLAHANGAPGLVLLCLVLGGLTLGFLVHNFSPSNKVFLGDTGSQFLGAMLGLLTMALMELPHARSHYSFFVPVLIVGYPLFDIAVAMVRRFSCHGRKKFLARFTHMFMADNEHLHHRMVYLGMSHVQSAFLLLLVAGSMGSAAVIFSRAQAGLSAAVAGYLVLTLFLILNRLGYVGLKPWISIPRMKPLPGRIIGLVDPDEVFLHSLKNFDQDKFEFLPMTGRMSKFLGSDLTAVLLYNADPVKFEEQWTHVLREAEFQDSMAVVIAGQAELEKVRRLNPDGFSSVHLVEKPVRVPELVKEMEWLDQRNRKVKVAQTEQRFSLAELAMRKARDERQQA